MSQVDQLLSEYKEAHRAGSGDPRPFLSRAPAEDRPLLAALIEGYLEHAPRRELDRNERLDSGGWPVRGNPAVAGGASGFAALGWRAASPRRPNEPTWCASWRRVWGGVQQTRCRLLPQGRGVRPPTACRHGLARSADREWGESLERRASLPAPGLRRTGGSVHAHDPSAHGPCRGPAPAWPPRSGTRSTAFPGS